MSGRYQGDYPPMSSRGRVALVVGLTCAVFAIIFGMVACASREAPPKGYFAVCQTGGPIEGDSGTCGFRPSGSGKAMTGSFFSSWGNELVTFPAQNRFWWAQTDVDDNGRARRPRGADRAAQTLPVANGGRVAVSYKFTAKLKQDEATAYDLYKKHGLRSYGGATAGNKEDTDEWFEDFLGSQVNSVLERVNREEISPETCAALNPSCDLNKLNTLLDQLASNDPQKVAEAEQQRDTDGAQANSRLVALSQNIEDRLKGAPGCKTTAASQARVKTCGELARALEGEFFTDISFEIIKVDPPTSLVAQIDGANAKLAQLVQTKADARNKREAAAGEANANEEIARGRRALANAISKDSRVAQIEVIKALCGVEIVDNREVPKGCGNLETLGGNISILKGQ